MVADHVRSFDLRTAGGFDLGSERLSTVGFRAAGGPSDDRRVDPGPSTLVVVRGVDRRELFDFRTNRSKMPRPGASVSGPRRSTNQGPAVVAGIDDRSKTRSSLFEASH